MQGFAIAGKDASTNDAADDDELNGSLDNVRYLGT